MNKTYTINHALLTRCALGDDTPFAQERSAL